MKRVLIKKQAGEFGENKDVAKRIRLETVLPALEKQEKVVLDFDGMSGVTQSFVHALISDPIRKYPDGFFDLVSFKNCNPLVKTVVEIVSDYMQESLIA